MVSTAAEVPVAVPAQGVAIALPVRIFQSLQIALARKNNVVCFTLGVLSFRTPILYKTTFISPEYRYVNLK